MNQRFNFGNIELIEVAYLTILIIVHSSNQQQQSS
jgi:hypothetical protein